MKAISLLKVLFLTYVFTGLLLLLLSLGLYKLGLTEQQISVSMYVVYFLSGLFGGFLVGRVMKTRKFLWGGLIGVLYFLILLGVSLLMQEGIDSTKPVLALNGLLCVCGGILGGMIG